MSELSPVQKRLLIMMDWFHEYCQKNHLTYYMIGGTMLGAIRHQGFIPWDDDIDVGMPREDYFRLIELLEGKIEEIYTLETYRSGNLDFCTPFAKLYDTETTLVEDRNPPVRRGLFIDVFPLDGASDKILWKLNYKIFRFRKNTLSVLTAKEHKEYSRRLNTVIKLTSKLPVKGYIAHHLQRRIDHFCASEPFSTEGIVANLVGSRKEKELLPGSFFGRPKLYRFEGRFYYGVEQADLYLSTLIGDYMQLPPENERKGHLINNCDLGNSYIDMK